MPKFVVGSPGGGLGDELLCTAVIHELRQRHEGQIWADVVHKELFANNADVAEILAPGDLSGPLHERILQQKGVGILRPRSLYYLHDEERWLPPDHHLIELMCRSVGIEGEVALRPYVHLSEEETQAGRFGDDQICIMSSGRTARYRMENRQWPLEKYQATADLLGRDFSVVQIGSPKDPLLRGVVDRRSPSLRLTAGILKASVCFVGQEGFLMHLARAVDCRAVGIFGVIPPTHAGYPGNENLFGEAPCAPCWQANGCDANHQCLKSITPQMVSDAAYRAADRRETPLPVTIVRI